MAQPQLCTGCVAASAYVMWGHCVWRHLLTCCTPAAPSGTAPQSMRREQLYFVFAHRDFDSSVIFDRLDGL